MGSVAMHADLQTADAVRIVDAPILVTGEADQPAGRDGGTTGRGGIGRRRPPFGGLLNYNIAERDVVGSTKGHELPIARIRAASAKGFLDSASRCVDERYRYSGSGAYREDWNDRGIGWYELETASGCAQVNREWSSWEGRAR